MKEQILKLRTEGNTYNEIVAIVKCSKSTVSYYCGEGQKEKTLQNTKLYRERKKLGIKVEKKDRKISDREKRKKFFKEMFPNLNGANLLKAISEYKILNDNYENMSFDRLRIRVILEQDKKCNNCKLYLWFEKPITLEIDHKDGNNKNNNRENLEALCPNCHALTETWRGRNRKDLEKREIVTKEMLKNAYLKNKKNIRQALISLNIAAKGSNYQRMYEALDMFNITYIKQSTINRTEKKNRYL